MILNTISSQIRNRCKQL